MTLTPGRYRAITVAALVALCAIVVSGTAVRLTGSGLGCEDWPNCNSQRFIDVSSNHTAIEQVNRMFTGIVAVAVIGAVLGARFRAPRRRDLEVLAWGLVAGVIGQIVLGGITVLVDLHPIAVQGHFLLSMILVANAAVLVHRAGQAENEPFLQGSLVTHRLLLAGLTAVALVTGTVVTGAGPHAGDEDVQRFDVAIGSAARVHSVAVIVAVTVAALLAWRLSRAGADDRTLGLMSSWIFVGLLQGAIGYVQYFNEIPEALVAAHVTMATVLWTLTVFLTVQTVAAADVDPQRAREPAVRI
jgi:cytochrome c oxidase assembly protein subunit 15